MNNQKIKKKRGPRKTTLSTLTAMVKHFRQYEIDNNLELDLSEDLPGGTWTIITPKLLSEGHKGNFVNTLSRNKAIVQNMLSNLRNSVTEPSEEPTQQSIYSELSEPCEQSVSSEPNEPITESDSHEPSDLDAKIDDRIQQRISELTSASFLQDLPLPPPRIKEKRVIKTGKRKGMERMKEIRDYDRPSFSIDKRIFRRFEKEATKRGMPQSTLLEAILLKAFNIKLD